MLDKFPFPLLLNRQDGPSAANKNKDSEIGSPSLIPITGLNNYVTSSLNKTKKDTGLTIL
jgi:hypothetical protein